MALATPCLAGSVDVASIVKDRLCHAQSVSGLQVAPVVHTSTIGWSRRGRSIGCVVLAKPPKSTEARIRILIIAGQHGNEPTPVRAALDLIDMLACGGNGAPSNTLDRFTIAVIPLANPDGFSARTRCNAAGADLNRDWDALSQPETKAIHRFAHRFHPQVIIDQHEWTIEDPNTPDCIELSGHGDAPHYKLARLLVSAHCGRWRDQPLVLKPVLYKPESDRRLAHRRFAREGFCSFLVETAPGRPLHDRIQAYNDFVLSVLSGLGDNSNPEVSAALARLAPKLAKRAPATVVLAPVKQPLGSRKTQNRYWIAFLFGSACIVGFAARSRKTGQRNVRSTANLRLGSRLEPILDRTARTRAR
jgi:hypothetical protein